LALIDKNLTTQINAPTGSGKSIGIPKALAERGQRVFVSVPTRVSATSLSNYLHYLNPDISVGYAAEGNSNYDQRTQVVYATSGHMRRKLLGYFSRGLLSSTQGLNFTDVLILDETHSGSLDNTIILSLCMYALKLKIPVPKLILLSATPSKLPIQPEPAVYAVPVPTPYPVTTIYDAADNEDDIYDHTLDLVLASHNDTRIKGDFLIFVPGSREADDLVNRLREKIDDAIILPAYSTLDSEELRLIYTPSPNNERKIIVATNIAESSITIDGLEVVFDCMQCKEAVASASGAIRLETVQITKSSAQQRLGRVGRTCPGTCYRMISQDDYELLEDHRRPEIERMPLHNTVMEFLKAGIDPIETIAGIDQYRVVNSIRLLTRLDMLKEEEGKQVVTPCGDFAPTVPLGVRNAAFLWRWIQQGYPIYPGIVIACLIDAHSTGYFYIPRKKNNMSTAEYNEFCDNYIQQTFKNWIGETPVHTYLNMWHSFTASLARSHFRLIDEPNSINFRRWARENSVNQRQLWEMISIVSQTYRIIRRDIHRVDVNVTVFDTNEIINKAIPIFQDIYSDNAMSPGWTDDMYHPVTMVKHVFDNRRIISNLERGNHDRIVLLASHEIITRTGRTLGYIDLFLPFPRPKVEELDNATDSDDD
jgi:ATP-dependent helicase HrpB